MKNPSSSGRLGRFLNWLATCKKITLLAASLALTAAQVGAQTTNAFDQATEAAYSGGFNSGANGGFGYGAWTISVTGTGGNFIQGNGPSGKSFDLWNVSANSATMAVRPLNSPLAAGQSFQVKFRLNSLDGSSRTNGLFLQDASGNTVFAYWHVGGDNLNGHYTDANVVNASAVNFPYAYQQFQTLTFTLTSATTYTFTDNSSGGQISGTVSGSIAKFAFFRGSQAGTGGGQDFQFDQPTIISAAPPSFQSLSPAAGVSSVATNATISLSVVAGGFPLNTNAGITLLSLDGTAVSPTVTGNSTLMNLSYTISLALAYGSQHTVQVVVQDNGSVNYTNTWNFTTGYPQLPVALPGVYAVSNGQDQTIFTAAGEVWLGTNYNTGSSQTLYTRATMTVLNNAGETGGGGFYCGYHFEVGNQERLLIGNNWASLNWSYSGGNSGAGDHDLNPFTTINLSEPHTLVTRIDFNPSGNDTVTVYLDPDFSQPELAQSSGIITTFTAANQFDNLRLRCGNGNNAITEFSNVLVSATPEGVGFAVDPAPRFQAIVPAAGSFDVSPATAVSAEVVSGSLPITGVTLAMDGGSVSPTITVAGGTTNVSYQPPTRLSSGVVHTIELVVTDSSNTTYTNTWSFTTGYDSLPLIMAGPISVANNVDATIFTANNDLWIGTNYQSSSSRTLYTRFTMNFDQLDVFGGLDFYQGNTERLLIGKTGGGGAGVNSTWSVYNTGGSPTDASVPPGISIVTGEWHTLVARTDYSPGGNTAVSVWLDPDFGQTEQAQPDAPLTFALNNTFDNIRLRAGNTSLANFTNIMVGATASAVGFAAPVGPTFQAYAPAQNATTVSPSSPVGVTALFGNAGISSNAVTMTLDGNTVMPSFVKTATYLFMSYQPAVPLVVGSAHTVVVSLADANGSPAATTWSFTVDPYPSLPVTIAGPISVTGGGAGTTIFTSQNGWLAGNTYLNTNYSGVLWSKFSINVDNLDGETGGGGGFCGLHFYNGNNERLIVGNNWGSINWSYDAVNWGSGEFSSTAIPFQEWHTIVVKTTYVPANVDQVKIWLDPDLTHTENGQFTAPTEILADVTFDNIHVRAGNGATAAAYSNVVISATSPFAASVPPSVLSITGSQISWTSSGVLQAAAVLTGPWTDAANQANPQALNATNAAMFYRLRQ